MPQNLVQFVLLQLSPSSHEETVNILLVDTEDGDLLRISIDFARIESVHSADREYLVALIDEWRNTPPERLSDLIHELCRLSRGPLRFLQEKRVPFA
jgi:hypothetical protein